MAKTKKQETTTVESTPTDLQALLKCTSMETPTPADRQALVAYVETNGPEELARIVELAVRVQAVIVSGPFAGNYGRQQAIAYKLAMLKAELGEPDASPLEKLLIDAVATAWLRYQVVELLYATNTKEA